MQASPWWTLGEKLGGAYELYALLLAIGCLGPHLLMLGGYLWAEGRRVPRLLLVPLELVYGLLNPVVYLLIFQPALFRRASPGWLTSLSWVLLVTYWCARLFGPALLAPSPAWRRPIRGLLLGCASVITALALRDLVACILEVLGSRKPIGVLATPVLVLVYGPLYFLPLAIARRQLRSTRTQEDWGHETFFIRSRVVRWVTAPVALVLVGTVVVALWRPPEAATRQQVLAHRKDIIDVSARAGLDPRLLASIVYVTHREHTTPFRVALEEMAASAWLVDPTSHMLISGALDPSLGLAQVKPLTVLTALAIHHTSAGGSWLPSKEYREVPKQGDGWKRIPAAALAAVRPPATLERAGKQRIVNALLDPAQNLALSAFVLELTAAQWEAANPAWNIRTRPDILATLYQLGFQRSHPKPDPQANAFGERVLEVLREPWMQEHFATACLAE